METLPEDILVTFPDKYTLVLFSQTNKLFYNLLNSSNLWTRIAKRQLPRYPRISLASIGYVYNIFCCSANSHLKIIKCWGRDTCWEITHCHNHRSESLVVLYHRITDDFTIHDGIVLIENAKQSQSVWTLLDEIVGDFSSVVGIIIN